MRTMTVEQEKKGLNNIYDFVFDKNSRIWNKIDKKKIFSNLEKLDENQITTQLQEAILFQDFSGDEALFEKEGLAKDTFRYNLQNIQALPYSISKVSSFNNNNKIFPFIEKYEATSAEVNALIEKINYTSMELGVVSTISNYIVSGNKYFISGDIIRLDNITEDSHMAEAIYLEINKGVYM